MFPTLPLYHTKRSLQGEGVKQFWLAIRDFNFFLLVKDPKSNHHSMNKLGEGIIPSLGFKMIEEIGLFEQTPNFYKLRSQSSHKKC